MSKEDISGMRPKLGDTSITLPITFDYSGGRKDKSKSAKLWSVIISIIGLIVAIGILIGDKEIYIKIPLAVVILLGVMFLVRFVLLKEYKRKEEYKALLSSDYKLEYKSIWGIFKVEDNYPYICRFRNGKSGLYIRLNKDVILGKYAESEYAHYEAIADAYNLAGAGRVQMVHLDYMNNVGTDERLESSFVALENVSNPDLKDLLTDMYSYQQNNMQKRVSTFDTYVFLWTGNDVTAWNTISRILNCFLDANYRSYQILGEKGLRELAKVIFNLKDFSVVKASSDTFDVTGTSSVVPISVTSADGTVEKFNKTADEKAKEREARIAEQNAKKREIERRKKNKRKKGKSEDTDEVLDDIF